MATAQRNDFSFEDFNKLTERVPAGLQVFLAQQLLANALWQLEKWDNPRASDVSEVFTQVKILRSHMKADAEARAKAL